MGIVALIIEEMRTPSGQAGPLSAAYLRAAQGVWHGVLGALAVSVLGMEAGLVAGFLIGAGYWLAKERGDLGRGGALWDGVEDALMVSLGAWYGAPEWPALICGAGLYIMGAAAWRTR